MPLCEADSGELGEGKSVPLMQAGDGELNNFPLAFGSRLRIE
jgi:hypothetical protein